MIVVALAFLDFIRERENMVIALSISHILVQFLEMILDSVEDFRQRKILMVPHNLTNFRIV